MGDLKWPVRRRRVTSSSNAMRILHLNWVGMLRDVVDLVPGAVKELLQWGPMRRRGTGRCTQDACRYLLPFHIAAQCCCCRLPDADNCKKYQKETILLRANVKQSKQGVRMRVATCFLYTLLLTAADCQTQTAAKSIK